MFKTTQSEEKTPIAAEAFKGLAEKQRLMAAFDALVIAEDAEELAELLEEVCP